MAVEEAADARVRSRMSTRWTFTLNNPADDARPMLNPMMDYIVWQLERGEAGTRHLQGYVRFVARKRLATAKDALRLGDGVHMEIARGSEEDNKRYCTKEETRIGGPTDHGEEGNYDADKGKQGFRSDLKGITERIIAGDSMRDIAIAKPVDFVRYHSGLRCLQDTVKAPPPDIRPVRAIWIWGPTGTGKTHWVRTMFQPEQVYAIVGLPAAHPWDGYTGQSTLLLDEWEDRFYPVTQMNAILDKWPLTLPARYSNKAAYWTTVIIVSNSSPNEAYNTGATAVTEPLLQAFRRRFGAMPYNSGCYCKATYDTPIEGAPRNPEW